MGGYTTTKNYHTTKKTKGGLRGSRHMVKKLALVKTLLRNMIIILEMIGSFVGLGLGTDPHIKRNIWMSSFQPNELFVNRTTIEEAILRVASNRQIEHKKLREDFTCNIGDLENKVRHRVNIISD
ncbi:hypothetical protein LguiA_011577 [Lonicera macranthoides]